MFEVGKKYYLTPYTDKVFECIWVDGDKAVLKNPKAPWLHGGVHTTNLANFGSYKEHKEPRTITRWVNVYEDVKSGYLSFGNMWEDKDCAVRHGRGSDKTYMTYKDTITVSYTEPS